MNCRSFRNQLDALDNDDLPIEMLVHARSCPECAAEAAALKAALSLYRLPDLVGSPDVAPRVMALLPFVPAPRRSVSMGNWLVTGFVIVFSMVLVPLLAEFRALKAVYGNVFTVSLSMALGLFVTLYAGAFIMSHLDEFTRRLKEREAQHGRAT